MGSLLGGEQTVLTSYLTPLTNYKQVPGHLAQATTCLRCQFICPSFDAIKHELLKEAPLNKQQTPIHRVYLRLYMQTMTIHRGPLTDAIGNAASDIQTSIPSNKQAVTGRDMSRSHGK